MAEVFDVAVVGLGAVGSAALHQAAARGAKVVGLDQFHPPHSFGSSHGESRITRQAIGEGLAYVPLVLRSNELWEALEVASGRRLLERCGFLFITRDEGASHHAKPGFLGRTVAAAQAFGIPHELLTGDEIATRFPQFAGLTGEEQAYFEPGGGYLRPEQCILAALAEATQSGAKTRLGARVANVRSVSGHIRIETESGVTHAKRCILAAGSWLPRFLAPSIAQRIEVHRQVLHWFRVESGSAYQPGRTPTFIWAHGAVAHEQFYGFPPIDGEVKVAREDYAARFDPDADPREVGPEDGEAMAARHTRGRLAGLSARPARSEVCHYAVASDNDFIVDLLDEQVAYASACSGHGFKHAAAVGEALAQWALDEAPTCDLSPFRATRFD